MANQKTPVLSWPLALPAVDDKLAFSPERPIADVALELLGGLVGDRDNPIAVVRSRYRQASAAEKELLVPQHESILHHIIRPLQEAKQCYVLGMPLACIAQAGLVGEMVAVWRFHMLQPKVDGREFTGELQQLLLGREFDTLGQQERVRVLRGLEQVEPDVLAAFGELRALQGQHLRFMVDLPLDRDADARRALHCAILLVARTLGTTFQDGAMVLPERVSRYIAGLVNGAAPGIHPAAMLIPLTQEARDALGDEARVQIAYVPFKVGRECRSPTARLIAAIERRNRLTPSLNDLYLLEEATNQGFHVSREHFMIDRAGQDFVLTDLDSAWGTCVGGVALDADAINRHVVLRNGDTIVVGSQGSPYRYQFRLAGSD